MSKNCIHCVKNTRTGFDLLCDECRAADARPEPYWICGRRCGWRGTDTQKLVRNDGDGWSTLLCPECGADSFWAEKPLFIPLKAKFFNAFERGEKDTEYRLRGGRWNGETCRIGRRVVLSCGYGKTRRLTGEIIGFSYDTAPGKMPGWVACYGSRAGDAACIRIRVHSCPSVVEK